MISITINEIKDLLFINMLFIPMVNSI